MKEVKGMHTSSNQNRRRFLKKALYATPTLVVLGTLAKPTNLVAGTNSIPGTPIRSLNTNVQTNTKSLNNSTSL